MIQSQCTGRGTIVVFDGGTQFREDVFKILLGCGHRDDLGMHVFFLIGLLLLHNVSHGVEEAIILKVLFIQVRRILVRQQRVCLDRQLLAVEVLVSDIVRDVRCARSHGHRHCDDEDKRQRCDFLFHGSSSFHVHGRLSSD